MDSAILLVNPKYPVNVGNVIRACASWCIPTLRWTGDRVIVDEIEGRLPREERMRDYQDVDWERTEHPKPTELFPNLVPIAVEVRETSQPLHRYEHPENALYIFGPEDGSIPKSYLHACHDFIVIPTIHCLNLAAAVNVVLYDREAKYRNKYEVLV